MAEVRPVRKADLTALEPLLRASFGRDDFELQDELETFDETREDWFVLLEPTPQGFIRYFLVTENVYVGELFAVPGPERAERLRRLLGHFLAHLRLPRSAWLRLDVPLSDAELNGLLSRVPGTVTKTFAFYQVRTPATTSAVQPSFERYSESDLGQV